MPPTSPPLLSSEAAMVLLLILTLIMSVTRIIALLLLRPLLKEAEEKLAKMTPAEREQHERERQSWVAETMWHSRLGGPP